MRQRLTFIHKPEDHVDPAKLQITDYSIQGPNFDALREERITLALDELPLFFQDIFKDAQELHIK